MPNLDFVSRGPEFLVTPLQRSGSNRTNIQGLELGDTWSTLSTVHQATSVNFVNENENETGR